MPHKNLYCLAHTSGPSTMISLLVRVTLATPIWSNSISTAALTISSIVMMEAALTSFKGITDALLLTLKQHKIYKHAYHIEGVMEEPSVWTDPMSWSAFSLTLMMGITRSAG